MFAWFMIIGAVAAISAAAGVTATTWFFMSNAPNPLTAEWAGYLFAGVAALVLLAALLLYLAVCLATGLRRLVLGKPEAR